jgi:hypothetical protein
VRGITVYPGAQTMFDVLDLKPKRKPKAAPAIGQGEPLLFGDLAPTPEPNQSNLFEIEEEDKQKEV